MHAFSSYRGNRHRPLSQTHRQDRLQYTAPQLASTQCKYVTQWDIPNKSIVSYNTPASPSVTYWILISYFHNVYVFLGANVAPFLSFSYTLLLHLLEVLNEQINDDDDDDLCIFWLDFDLSKSLLVAPNGASATDRFSLSSSFLSRCLHFPPVVLQACCPRFSLQVLFSRCSVQWC